jgi:hypothetical protein
MNRHFSFVLTGIAAILLFVLGCSGEMPVSPISGNGITQNVLSNGTSGRVLWGMWHVAIDSSTGQVEIVPLRGASFNANVQQFLSPPFSPTNKMSISILPGSDLANGYAEVDVTFTHPFPGLNQYRGFDVRGIFMADGSHQSLHDTNLIYGDPDFNEAYVLNPDGYTRWWNATEFTDSMALLSFKPGKLGSDKSPSATLNPYKYYADDLAFDQDVSEMTTSSRGVFSPIGSIHNRIYKIQFPVIAGAPSYMFNYAVDASWFEPDKSFAPDYPIEAFSSSAQCQEAYHLSSNTNESDVWFDGSTSGGTMRMEVEVFDWQGMVNPSGVPGEIKAIWVESSVMKAPVDVLPMSLITAGSQPTSSVFSVDLSGADLNVTSSGQFPLLISVESKSPDTYQPQIDGGSSFIFPDGPLAACTMGSITVVDKELNAPALDVTGNLKLAVVRNSSNSITGISLDWTANTNPSPFYAIYADDNPYNGINPGIFVAEVSTDTATIDSTLWPSFSTNNGYAFGVKGRSVSGLVSSESPNMSQLAFVEMEDFDGGASSGAWTIGYSDPAYQWASQASGQIDGSASMRENESAPVNQWSAIVGPIVPGIADSEMSFLEFAHVSSVTGWSEAFSGGFTHSLPPTGTSQYLDYDTTEDFYAVMDGTFDWVPPCGPPPGCGWTALVERYGWNPSYTFFGWRAFDMPKGTAKVTRLNMPFYQTDAGTIRPGLAWATLSYAPGNSWIEADEIAVVVY